MFVTEDIIGGLHTEDTGYILYEKRAACICASNYDAQQIKIVLLEAIQHHLMQLR